MIVYHYTTKESYNEIMRTREFQPSFFSTALDAVYGEGWYFTDLPPLSSNEELYQIWGQPEPERVECYLVFDIDYSTLLQDTRPNVYKLPLERMRENTIKLTSYYVENKIVIKFIRGGNRR